MENITTEPSVKWRTYLNMCGCKATRPIVLLCAGSKCQKCGLADRGLVTYISRIETIMNRNWIKQPGLFFRADQGDLWTPKVNQIKNAQLRYFQSKFLSPSQILKANLPLHTTPASSWCRQLCTPIPMFLHSVRRGSSPVQLTSSRKTLPLPWPNVALPLDSAPAKEMACIDCCCCCFHTVFHPYCCCRHYYWWWYMLLLLLSCDALIVLLTECMIQFSTRKFNFSFFQVQKN